MLSKKIRLVPIEEHHLEWMYQCRNDDSIRHWCRQVGLIRWDEHWSWYESLAGDKSRQMFVMREERSFGDFGVVGLTSIDQVARRAEFSIWVEPQNQGKGLATEGMKAICNYGFLELGLNSIWGESFEGNPGIKIWEKLGFKKDGIRRDFYYKNGSFVDAHLCSLLRSEWMEQEWSKPY